MKITVLLVDDHTIVRQGLKALLTATGEIEVIGEAATGRAAVAAAKKLLPDVVVMDFAMPEMNGLEATRQIYGKTRSFNSLPRASPTSRSRAILKSVSRPLKSTVNR